MASKRRSSKAILNPNSFCGNEEVTLRNRDSLLFDEFNKCVASLRDRLRPSNTSEFSPSRVNFKALTLSILQPNPYPWPAGVNIDINKSH